MRQARALVRGELGHCNLDQMWPSIENLRKFEGKPGYEDRLLLLLKTNCKVTSTETAESLCREKSDLDISKIINNSYHFCIDDVSFIIIL